MLVAKMGNLRSTCRRYRTEKIISINTVQIQENSVLNKLQEKMSSWTKMERFMALMLAIKDMLLKRINIALLWQQLSRIIDVEMIQKVQVAIFNNGSNWIFLQRNQIPNVKKGMVASYSSVSQVDPFLDSDNIIRVDGRLRKSSLT